ncbi:transposase, partial [Candidatus Venteria ishoeyi]|uniref:transposase n=1 Tax=Candidatus Venteria ishoeyi TaxID=1899563 RepID=UPI000ADDEBF3
YDDIQTSSCLSVKRLLEAVRKTFTKIPEHRTASVEYSLVDTLMSGAAVFSLKFPSLLKFDENREEAHIKHNLQTLYGVSGQAPCDTQMRTILDPVEPAQVAKGFDTLHRSLERNGVLREFKYLGALVILLDATGEYSSNCIGCPDCCTRTHSDGTVEYYHQMLAAVIACPNKKTVLPLAPEPIIKQKDASKNDCEINAAKRLMPKIRKLFPKRKIIIAADGIYSKGPFIKLLKELNFDYILVAKESDHVNLVNEYIERRVASKAEEYEETKDGLTQGFCWTNDLSLNASHSDIKVNLLNFWEIKQDEEKPHSWIWITNLKLTRRSVCRVMRAGRCRWKVENETFNTLKNQGYNLEHNYGHGKQHLATVFGYLMLLMFLIDQIQEACCPLFQAARNRLHSRTSLWEKLRGFFTNYFIESWEDIWLSVIYGNQRGALAPNTS